MNGKNEDQIYIVTELGESPRQTRVERGITEKVAQGTIHAVSASTLKKNMVGFFGQLREILDTGGEKIGNFEVGQVEIAAQVTGDGKVCLLGSGVEIGFQGGIKFVLKRMSG